MSDTNTNNEKNIEFSFGWLALKLLGKNLYSNAWSAISELVANGFDAGATQVYVYINDSNKNKANIEIFDNGRGMSFEEINTYVKVGYNKRKDISDKTIRNSLMGRKGIGKLAALYLSEEYYLLTKTEEDSSKWKMNYAENEANEDQKPFLRELGDDIQLESSEYWDKFETGTFLKLIGVNLKGLGKVAYDSLSHRLANNFSLDSMTNKKIFLCIFSEKKKIVFSQVEKKVAFGNMAYINYNLGDGEAEDLKNKIKALEGQTVILPYSSLDLDKQYEHKICIDLLKSFNNDKQTTSKITGVYKGINLEGKEISKNYELKGWIGIHSTIVQNAARSNDENFIKTNSYNPTQIRLYIRNKLAVENFLTMVQNTQAFVNYIEGDIHFDILDDDDLPDIATSNRQSLDENDDRIKILIELVKANIQDLIKKRNELADAIKKLKKTEQSSAKKQFSKELGEELDKLKNISDGEKSEFHAVMTNKIKGDVTPKDRYIVFISHSSKDKIFTHFLFEMLKACGVESNEIFYTSNERDINKYDDISPLREQIKENITNANALIFYLTSKHYKESEYCMFEGGAGWATRGVGDYLLMTVEYEDIPKLLTNGKNEFQLLDSTSGKKNIHLNEKAYLFIINIMNKIFEHINSGRKLNNRPQIKLFNIPVFPSSLEMEKTEKKPQDYMDESFLKHWEHYVTKEITAYMNDYIKA